MTVVALLQLDPTVGAYKANVAEVEEAVSLAAKEGADMAVASELIVSGYPPRDLLMDVEFVANCQAAALEVKSPIPLLIGTPLSAKKDRQKPYNGVVRVAEGRSSRIVGRKQLLPTYDVFDEGRYFQADDSVIQALKEIDFSHFYNNVAYVAALSLQEINYELNKYFNKDNFNL